jgi:hypothetical protein
MKMKRLCHQPAVNLTDEDLAIFRSLKDIVYALETAEEATGKPFIKHPAFQSLKEIARLEALIGKIPETCNLQIIVDELNEEDFRHNSHFIPCNGAFIALMRFARKQDMQRMLKEELGL